MLPAYCVHDEFFQGASDLRAGFEEHFAEPYRHGPDTHQVWNYWHVPGSYTYLRTSPEKVLPLTPLQAFWRHLQRFALERYGFGKVYWPFLSLYVAGCQQVLHNDAENGRLGYVYSLTKWDERKFLGGETLIFRERDYFASAAISRAAASVDLFELIPARFNRLLVFDDRLPHAVPRLEGTMVPQDGRVVLHGHFVEGPPVVEGGLTADGVQITLSQHRRRLDEIVATVGRSLAGLVNLRVGVAPDGLVIGVEVLFDRLMPTARDAGDPDRAVAAVAELIGGVRFLQAGGASRVTIPIAFGRGLG